MTRQPSETSSYVLSELELEPLGLEGGSPLSAAVKKSGWAVPRILGSQNRGIGIGIRQTRGFRCLGDLVIQYKRCRYVVFSGHELELGNCRPS